MREKKIEGQVYNFHGETADLLKEYLVYKVPRCDRDDDGYNLRLGLVTNSGICGTDDPYCGLTLRDGFPDSIVNMLQSDGRAGRSPLSDLNDPLYECWHFTTLSSWKALILRSEKSSGEAKRWQREQIMDVLRFLLLPTECYHTALGKWFEKPAELATPVVAVDLRRSTRHSGSSKNKRKEREEVEEGVEDEGEEDGEEEHSCPLGGRCSYCCPTVVKFEVNALRTIRVLRRDAFKHTTTASPESVVTALKKEVDQIFNNSQVRHPCKYDVENLVLQLIAAGILNFEVKGKDRTNKKGDKEKVLSIHLFLAVQGEEEAREDGDSEDRWFKYEDKNRWSGIGDYNLPCKT